MNVRLRFKYPDNPIRYIKGREIAPNPANWRTHPIDQIDALKGILAEVGMCDAVKGYELPDGRVMLIDGHARVEILPDQDVPVLILDVTDAEAKKLLLTYDPLGDKAGADAARLQELLEQCEFESTALMQSMNELADLHGLLDSGGGEADEKATAGEQALPEKYQILIIFDDEQTQTHWLEKLATEGLNCRSLIS